METIIVTGQATTDALSGAAGTSNLITIYDAPKIRDVVSAKIISKHNASGITATVLSGVAGATSGVSYIANFYPVARASLGSGTITSGQVAVASGVTASGAVIQIATTSGGGSTGGFADISTDQTLVLKVSTRGEVVRR